MSFANLDLGMNHYKNYGRYCGFMTRKGTQKSSRYAITLKYVTCAREGERSTRSEEHDEELTQYKKGGVSPRDSISFDSTYGTNRYGINSIQFQTELSIIT